MVSIRRLEAFARCGQGRLPSVLEARSWFDNTRARPTSTLRDRNSHRSASGDCDPTCNTGPDSNSELGLGEPALSPNRERSFRLQDMRRVAAVLLVFLSGSCK